MYASAAESPITVSTVQVDGRELHVRQIGAGFPVLLLNGLGLPLGMWARLEPELAGFRLIEVDLPGSGRSVPTRPPISMHSYARLAVGLLDVLEIKKADTLGLSFGGMMAQQLAIDAPDRIRKLVLASTSCGWGSVPTNPLLWTSRLFQRRARPDRERRPTGGAPGRPTAPRAALRGDNSISDGRLPDPRAYAHQLLAASTWSSLPLLRGVENQTLIIGGSADLLVPEANMYVLAAWLPNARTHVVAGGGHLCVLDRAAEVGPVIARFLAGRSPDPGFPTIPA